MQKTGAVLLGVSPDTPKAQKKFQEKFDLPFTLLADVDKKVAEAFGVMKEKNMYGKKVWGVARTTCRRSAGLPKRIGQRRGLRACMGKHRCYASIREGPEFSRAVRAAKQNRL